MYVIKIGYRCTLEEAKPSKSFLMTSKDKDPITKKNALTHSYKCDRVKCDEEYIVQSSRTFGERFKQGSVTNT